MSSKIWIRLLLVLIALLVGVWFLRLDFGGKVTTNVLGLMPDDSNAPELSLVRALASEKQARSVVIAIVGRDDQVDQVRAATTWFADEQGRDPLFEQVTPLDSAQQFTKAGEYLYQHRFQLGFASWLEEMDQAYTQEGGDQARAEWVAERAVTRLEDFLSRPEALVASEVVGRDPLLLMLPAIELVAEAQQESARPSNVGLVWALQRTAPFEEGGQKVVSDAMERFAQALKEKFPGLELRWTAVSRFATHNRREIERDLTLLNTLSIAGVAMVALLGVSRIRRVWHLIPPLLIGTSGAWIFTTAFFDQVHILVLVIGALLSGVAIDYGFYLFVQPPAFPGETYRQKVLRLRAPLLGSALTTVLGFLLLCWSELPFLRQLGVFVSAGLLCSLAGSLLWFGQIQSHHLPVRQYANVQFGLAPERKRPALFVALLMGVGAILGVTRVHWVDNVNLLQVPSEELRSNATQLRGWMGESSATTAYISSGADYGEARAAWQALAEKAGDSAGMFSLARVLPSMEAYEAAAKRHGELADFPTQFAGRLDDEGYEPSMSEAVRRDWPREMSPDSGYEQLVDGLVGSLQGPLSLLAGRNADRAWFVTLLPRSDLVPPPGTVAVTQLENLNRLFAQYRASALNLGLLGLAVLFLSVLIMYGVRRGPAVFAVSCGAMCLAFGFFGWLRLPLNLFHLLGAFLGVCLSHNYAIFMTENRLRGDAFPPSVRLSATATAVSFGVLGLSAIPVVRSLGVTVAVIVVIAWWMAEFIFVLLRRPIGGENSSPHAP